MSRVLTDLAMLGAIVAGLVAPSADAGNARAPIIPARVIERLERDLQSRSPDKWTISHCVRVYTIKTENGKQTGFGVITLPGRGVGYPVDVKVDAVDPTRLKPGYYIVAPGRVPVIPIAFRITDFGMYIVWFDPTTGALIPDQ